MENTKIMMQESKPQADPTLKQFDLTSTDSEDLSNLEE